MMYKIMTWDKFREVTAYDAQLWVDNGDTPDELTEEDILNEYPTDYFEEYDERPETDDLSSAFTPHDFAIATLECMEQILNS